LQLEILAANFSFSLSFSIMFLNLIHQILVIKFLKLLMTLSGGFYSNVCDVDVADAV
jgi:hypothetical protein